MQFPNTASLGGHPGGSLEAIHLKAEQLQAADRSLKSLPRYIMDGTAHILDTQPWEAFNALVPAVQKFGAHWPLIPGHEYCTALMQAWRAMPGACCTCLLMPSGSLSELHCGQWSLALGAALLHALTPEITVAVQRASRSSQSAEPATSPALYATACSTVCHTGAVLKAGSQRIPCQSFRCTCLLPGTLSALCTQQCRHAACGRTLRCTDMLASRVPQAELL